MRDLERAEIGFVYGARGGGRSAGHSVRGPQKGKARPSGSSQGAESQGAASPGDA